MAIFKYEDKAIHYILEGDHEETLLLLNGIMMSTKSWDVFAPAFLKHFNLLRVDMLDQGQSSKMTGDYTQSIQVDMLEALLTHLQLTKIHIMGISYGGSVALQYAAKYQGRIGKLILLNAVMKTTPWLKAIGDGWNAVADSRNGLAYYHVAIPMIYSPDFYNRNLTWMENRKALLIPLFSTPDFLDAMNRLTKSAETHDVSEALATIQTKTLVVSGANDYLTPPFEQVRLVEKMPNAQLMTFEDCGHASMYEKPDLFVSTVLGFLLENQKEYTI